MTRRRFYTAVSVTGDNGIALDGRVVKTPLKAPLRLPNRALAEAVAAEWAAQGETIDPGTMLFTKLANTAIDRIAGHRPRIVGEILDYAGSDLVCYRAEAPQPLVARQAAVWDPVVDWTRTRLDAPVAVHAGVMHQPQPPAVLAAVESPIAALSAKLQTRGHIVTYVRQQPNRRYALGPRLIRLGESASRLISSKRRLSICSKSIPTRISR